MPHQGSCELGRALGLLEVLGSEVRRDFSLLLQLQSGGLVLRKQLRKVLVIEMSGSSTEPGRLVICDDLFGRRSQDRQAPGEEEGGVPCAPSHAHRHLP